MDGDGKFAPTQFELDRFLTHQAPLFSRTRLLPLEGSFAAD